jgi:hypothetical protein
MASRRKKATELTKDLMNDMLGDFVFEMLEKATKETMNIDNLDKLTDEQYALIFGKRQKHRQ